MAIAIAGEDRKFCTIKTRKLTLKIQAQPESVDYAVKVDGKLLRYIRIYAKNVGRYPKWHQGAGDKAWIFCDEIVVE